MIVFFNGQKNHCNSFVVVSELEKVYEKWTHFNIKRQHIFSGGYGLLLFRNGLRKCYFLVHKNHYGENILVKSSRLISVTFTLLFKYYKINCDRCYLLCSWRNVAKFWHSRLTCLFLPDVPPLHILWPYSRSWWSNNCMPWKYEL